MALQPFLIWRRDPLYVDNTECVLLRVRFCDASAALDSGQLASASFCVFLGRPSSFQGVLLVHMVAQRPGSQYTRGIVLMPYKSSRHRADS